MYREGKPLTQQVYSGEKGHKFSIMRVASFHHSERFASCSFDGTVRIWKENHQEKVLFFFSEAIEGMEITPDDRNIIVVLANSSKGIVYNVEEDQILEIGEDRNLVLRSIFGTNPSSTKTAFITFEDDLFFFDHHSGQLSPRIFIENVSGDSLIWIDETTVGIPKRNGNIILVDSEKKSIKNEINVHDGLITSVCRDGDTIVTVSEDGTGKVLDLEFNPQFGFKIDFTPVSVDYMNSLGLIVVSGDRNLLVVNTTDGNISKYEQALSGCNAILTNDSRIIKGTGENNISFFTPNGELISEIKGRSNTAESVTKISDSNMIIGSGDNSVHFLNYISGQDDIIISHEETVSSILFIHSLNHVISGGYDDCISIYDLTNQREIKRIKKVPLVSALAAAPTGDIFIAGCSGDNTLHVFDTKTGDRRSEWTAHEDFIGSLAFMSDEVIISGSDDNKITFWNRSGKLISSISTNSPVKSIETIPEYDYNITGHLNGDIYFWEKITNRKVAHHNLGIPVQYIKIIDDKLMFIAAQNRLYRMIMDKFHIINVEEIHKHTEPIRGIYWDNKKNEAITIDHSIEICVTSFTHAEEAPSSEDISDDSMVMFTPEESIEVTTPVEDREPVTQISGTGVEQLTKISDYLDTVIEQIKTVIIPTLHNFDIDAHGLEDSLKNLQLELRSKLSIDEELDKEEIEQSDNSKVQDWKSFDWGRKRK